jgi:hypothetical protein
MGWTKKRNNMKEPVPSKVKPTALWVCLECGRKFRSTAAAERAAMNGCPGCGGVDIDFE